MGFARDVQRFINKAKLRTEKYYRKIAFQLLTDIVDGTPFLTGVLKANWQVAINGQLSSAQLPAGSSSGAEPLAAGQQILGRVKVKDSITIYNNMVYARPVEEGLGPGARIPRRMVANAIELLKRDIGNL